jgi:membrane associated rhomboid family serine protease
MATWFLMSTSIIVSLWSFKHDIWSQAHLALRSTDSKFQQIITATTSFFVHASYLHLVMNMLVLWAFGPVVAYNESDG